MAIYHGHEILSRVVDGKLVFVVHEPHKIYGDDELPANFPSIVAAEEHVDKLRGRKDDAVSDYVMVPREPTAEEEYKRGQRDALDAVLSLNLKAAEKIARWSEKVPDPHGRIPFEVVLWVSEVATQLGFDAMEGDGASAPIPFGLLAGIIPQLEHVWEVHRWSKALDLLYHNSQSPGEIK